MRTNPALKPLLHRFFGLSFMPLQAKRAIPTTLSVLLAPAGPQPPGPGEAPQCPVAQRQRHADEVGWLTSLHEDIEDQSARVQRRLERAKQDLAAGQEGARCNACTHELRAIQEQVAVLQWRQQALGERRQQVALRLQEARQRLAGVQGWLGTGDPVLAPPAQQGH